MTLFQEKYRVESSRLPRRSYTENGAYFITICTKSRECLFGEIRNGMMELSEIGNLVAHEWQRTEHVRYYVTLDKWIVMPNHIHIILWIDRNDVIDGIVDIYQWKITDVVVETSRRDVSTTSKTTTNPIPRRDVSTTTPNKSQTPRLKPNSIGSIIAQFKSICTKRIRTMGYDDFAWQTRFYDHIIRNELALRNIRRYIMNNPIDWEHDRNNLESYDL